MECVGTLVRAGIYFYIFFRVHNTINQYENEQTNDGKRKQSRETAKMPNSMEN